MTDLQSQVNDRVNAFVAEITELARQAAYEMLSSALDQEEPGGRRISPARAGGLQSRRKGAKRTSDELKSMADAFLNHINENPGQRMENIAKELGYSTQELTLPVKKLLSSGQVRVEGQKRATSYYPEAEQADEPAPKSRGRSSKAKGKTRGRRRRKVS